MNRTLSEILVHPSSPCFVILGISSLAFAQGAECRCGSSKARSAASKKKNYGMIAMAAGLGGSASPLSVVASAKVALPRRRRASTASLATRAPRARSTGPMILGLAADRVARHLRADHRVHPVRQSRRITNLVARRGSEAARLGPFCVFGGCVGRFFRMAEEHKPGYSSTSRVSRRSRDPRRRSTSSAASARATSGESPRRYRRRRGLQVVGDDQRLPRRSRRYSST